MGTTAPPSFNGLFAALTAAWGSSAALEQPEAIRLKLLRIIAAITGRWYGRGLAADCGERGVMLYFQNLNWLNVRCRL